MEWSRKIITKNWFWFFLMAFVLGLITVVGIIGIFIGVFITMSAAQVVMYAMYDSIVGSSEPEGMQLEDHFVAEE